MTDLTLVRANGDACESNLFIRDLVERTRLWQDGALGTYTKCLVPAEGDAELLIEESLQGFDAGSKAPECAILGDPVRFRRDSIWQDDGDGRSRA